MANGQPDGFDVFLSFARAPDGACPTVELIRGMLAQFKPSGLDIRIRSSEPLDEGVATGAPENAAVFVAVVSEDYLGSGQVLEGARFAGAARERSATGEPPIFLLVESPVNPALIPNFLKAAVGKHEASGENSATTEALLKTACMNLAHEVSYALPDARAALAPSPEDPVPAQKKVFLAHTHESLHEDRRTILAALVHEGFAVAPQAHGGATREQILEATTRVSKADVSVHLLNGEYDEAAVEEALAAAGKTRRLVWLKPESDPYNSTLKDIFADVERGTDRTTPYKNSLEEFRSQLLQELGDPTGTPVDEPKPTPPPPSEDALIIYVYYESSDQNQSQHLTKFLQDQHCVPRIPMWDPQAEVKKRKEHHDEVMSYCHGILVVAGDAPFPSWLQAIQSENYKRWRRPIACCYFDPMDQAKNDFPRGEVRVIAVGSGLPAKAQSEVQEFLERVRRSKAAQVK